MSVSGHKSANPSLMLLILLMGDLFGWGTVQYYYDLLGNLWKIFIIDETCSLCMVMR